MRSLAPILAAGALALLAASCGGGGKSPGVANLADSSTTAVTTTTQSDSGPGGPAFGPPGGASGRGQFKLSMRVNAADGEKFSACMRKHGLPNYPDPNGQGVITIDSGMGIYPGSPEFRSAQTSCSKLLPNGGQPTPAQIAQQQQRLLALSACMRAHGLKDFPDPSNGGLQISVHPGSDLDPSNPIFQKARQACQKYALFKGG